MKRKAEIDLITMVVKKKTFANDNNPQQRRPHDPKHTMKKLIRVDNKDR